LMRPSREEQKRLVLRRAETERILERIRGEELRGREFSVEEVDAVLQLGDNVPPDPRNGEGMIEMQRLFTELYRRKYLRD